MIFRFAYPGFVIAGVLISALLAWWLVRREQQAQTAVRFSDVRNIKRIKPSLRLRLRKGLLALRVLAVLALFLAAGRPQSGLVMEEITSEGVDIMLAVDVSGSMEAPDFRPRNRLDVAKVVIEQFIKGRKNDRIGLVVFAGETYLQCPLTLDYGVLLDYLENNVQILMGKYIENGREKGMIENGTAIGLAIAQSVKRLQDSQAESKVVILLTDGENNAGEIAPLYAAELAKTLGVRVYTIGVGRSESVPQMVNDPIFGQFFQASQQQGSELDVETLQAIADTTNANFYLATDPQAMEQAFADIDALERTDIKVKEYQRFSELFVYFAGFGMALLVLELLLDNTIFMKLP